MPECADHDDVRHARHDLCRVFNRFSPSKLAVTGVEIDSRSAELVHACLEGKTGSCRAFFKNHDKRPVLQGVIRFIVLEFLFDDASTFDQVFVLGQSQVGKLEIMFDCHRPPGRINLRH